MGEINEVSFCDNTDYDDAIMSIGAEDRSWFGTNKVGDRQFKWNDDERKANDIMAQYRRKVRFTVH